MPGRDRHAAQRRRQGEPVLPARLQPRPRHRLRDLGRRHAGQHADARARPGLQRPELADPRAGRPHRYRKGPYYAEEGDFSSAGAARIGLFDALPRGIASRDRSASIGYARAPASPTRAALGGGNLLYAVEAAHNDGPWDNPEKFHRLNGVLRYSFGDEAHRSSITAMGYSAGWNSTDQIPQRAVDAGRDRPLRRDRPDRRRPHRALQPVVPRRAHGFDDGELQAQRLRDPLAARPVLQLHLLPRRPADRRRPVRAGRAAHGLVGLATSRSWNMQARRLRHDQHARPAGAPRPARSGRPLRDRRAPAHRDDAGERGARDQRRRSTPRTRRSGRPGCAASPACAPTASTSTSRARSPRTAASAAASLASPKLSLIFGPWAKTEYFVNYGYGYPQQRRARHHRDASPPSPIPTPASGRPSTRSTPLVRSKGGELGLRTEIVPGLQSSLALWQLRLGSELVFVGRCRRHRAEPRQQALRHRVEQPLHRDAVAADRRRPRDLARPLHRPRPDGAGDYIPGSIDKVASLGVTVADRGPWFGQFQLRYFGPRPLIEDNSQRSKATTLAYLRAGYKITPNVQARARRLQPVRPQGERHRLLLRVAPGGRGGAGVNDIHFHPVEPRSLRRADANF